MGDIPTEQLEQLIAPIITSLVGLVIVLWLKDLATKIAKGLSFRLNKAFNEGDKVILDNEPAIIVKIGFSQTVFAIYKSKKNTNEIETYWRYVANERISWVKLEKVITEINNG